MALFKWLFGKKEKIPLRLLPEELRGELAIFLRYIHLFNEKRVAIENLDKEWFEGDINEVIYYTRWILAILKKEYQKEREGRKITKWILKNHALPESELPEINKIDETINNLMKCLEFQLKLFNEFLKHQDMNRLHSESKVLVQEEEKLLFSEREILDNLLKALERKELAIKLYQARKTEYNVWMTPMEDIEKGLDFKFDSMIAYSMKLGKPIRVLDLGCDVGLCLKQLFDKYGSSIELHGMGIRREQLWKLGIRGTIRTVLKNESEKAVGLMLSHFEEKRLWNPNAIVWHVGHAELLSKRFKPEFFNFIYSHHGIMHAYDIIKALSECYIILKKGGIIAFDVGEQQKLKIEREQKLYEIIHTSMGLASTGQPTEILHLRKPFS